VSIKLIRLSKFYHNPNAGESPKTVEALKNVNLDINEGACTVFYGATGSGKTTLLSLMAGIIKPTYGEIVLGSLHGSRAGDREITQFREDHIGYVPQETLLIRDLTVLENILSPNMFRTESRRMLKSKARELLERLGIGNKAFSKPHELSGGEKKKAMIVRALLKKPDYLLADEPVAELDRESATDIMKLFNEYNRGGTAVVVASHKKLQLRQRCDVYFMYEGQIVEYSGGRRS
jgi:putative ABC transport system ATP-binding protein